MVNRNLVKKGAVLMSQNNNEASGFYIDLQKTLVQDGPKFLSHQLIVSNKTAYLKPTMSSMLFCMVYIVVGVFLIGLASYVYIMSQQIDLSVFLGGFGIAITTFGFTLIQPFLKWARFDKKKGVFSNTVDRNVKLSRILSLQVNNKMVKRNQGVNYPCYELNLLTKNGRRINILNHNNLQQMLADGDALSRFLEVELEDYRREIIQ